MIRLNMIVEGQTEETFVNKVISEHLAIQNIFVSVRSVETSRHKNKINRGGLSKYDKAKRDIERWIFDDPGAWFTTMFDLYGLPDDFPGMQNLPKTKDPYEKVKHIEEHLKNDIRFSKFIPYIQLHEFEAILFVDPRKIGDYYIDHDEAISKLHHVCSQFPSPEHINESPETAPSKRLIRFIPKYEFAKSTAGPAIAGTIGLEMIRSQCQHFASWLAELESLSLGDMVLCESNVQT